MRPLVWLRQNWLAVGLVSALVLVFILLKNSPTEGIDSLQSLDSLVSKGQPTIIKFYSNF
jgi:hypothetical protein